MDRQLVELLEFVVVFASATVMTGMVLWFRHAGRRALQPKELARLEEQLQGLQQSVDAVAVEVERISEGQRFTTKLLAERPEGGSAADAAHRITR